MNKLTKKIAAIGAAVMMMASISAMGVSASYGVNWEVYKPANSPSSAGRSVDNRTVSGLSTANDSAIDFQCGYFSGATSGTYVQSNMRKNSTDNVKLRKFGASGSSYFKSNWYAYSNGGKCAVTIRLKDFTGSNSLSIRGNAQ